MSSITITMNNQEFMQFEFLLCMTPNYVFIFLVLLRYWFIKDSGETGNKPFKSEFLMKKNISILIALTFILNFILAEVSFSSFRKIQYGKLLAFVYLIGAFSWYLSNWLIVYESKKDLTPAWYTHRIFWITSFIIFVARVYIDKKVNDNNKRC